MTERVQACIDIYRRLILERRLELLTEEEEEALLGQMDMLYNKMTAQEAEAAEARMKEVEEELASSMERPLILIEAEPDLRLVAQEVALNTQSPPRVAA